MDYCEDTIVNEFLVMRCQAGDKTALTALVTRWQPPLIRYAAVMTRDRELAADVLQDAWIKIIRALPGLRDPLKFPGWAYRIVNNQCLDALRRQPTANITEETLESPIRQLEIKNEVTSVLGRLSKEHRSVLALHYLQGFDIKEIAHITRAPQGTVKSRLHHARENFRVLLHADPTDQMENRDDNNQEHTRQQDSGSTDISYGPA